MPLHKQNSRYFTCDTPIKSIWPRISETRKPFIIVHPPVTYVTQCASLRTHVSHTCACSDEARVFCVSGGHVLRGAAVCRLWGVREGAGCVLPEIHTGKDPRPCVCVSHDFYIRGVSVSVIAHSMNRHRAAGERVCESHKCVDKNIKVLAIIKTIDCFHCYCPWDMCRWTHSQTWRV